jgi:hypothetical protein
MPTDITKEDIISFKEQHDEALQDMPKMMRELISIDVTYPGCYFASRCRRDKLLPEDEINSELFRLGRCAFSNMSGQWELVMETLNELKK